MKGTARSTGGLTVTCPRWSSAQADTSVRLRAELRFAPVHLTLALSQREKEFRRLPFCTRQRSHLPLLPLWEKNVPRAKPNGLR